VREAPNYLKQLSAGRVRPKVSDYCCDLLVVIRSSSMVRTFLQCLDERPIV